MLAYSAVVEIVLTIADLKIRTIARTVKIAIVSTDLTS